MIQIQKNRRGKKGPLQLFHNAVDIFRLLVLSNQQSQTIFILLKQETTVNLHILMLEPVKFGHFCLKSDLIVQIVFVDQLNY